jgi:hypothetical protein
MTVDGDATHKWWIWHGMECCELCGIVRRADRKNNPCRGRVRVVLKEEESGMGEARDNLVNVLRKHYSTPEAEEVVEAMSQFIGEVSGRRRYQPEPDTQAGEGSVAVSADTADPLAGQVDDSADDDADADAQDLADAAEEVEAQDAADEAASKKKKKRKKHA